MDINRLANNALDLIKLNYVLPKKGILAGGCLGNLIWEQVSGITAVINDIDIFIYNRKLNLNDAGEFNSNMNNGKKLFYRSQDKVYWKDYTGFCEGFKNNSFYLIENSKNEGLINYINYSSTSDDTSMIIESFDINCTQVGYDIENNKFFWTEEFEEFLKTGNLKFTNLGSPAHSVIRILKKRDELKADLNEIEIKLCVYAIGRPLQGITRKYFSDKYSDLYKVYVDELSKYFSIIRDKEISELISKSKNTDINIFKLILNEEYSENISHENFWTEESFEKENFQKIWHCNDLLFYIRNFEKETFNYKIWSFLQPLYTYDRYVDCEISDEDLDMMKRLIENIPNSIINLRNISLSKQLNLVKKLYKSFEYDINIAFALLDTKKLDPEIIIDSETKLLLELSVRKEIINNNYDLKRIMGIIENSSNYFDN
jgi:hypothetical protein